MAPALKLIYFEAAGRAEASRIMLKYAGIPFENVTVTRDTWPQQKAQMPYGQVPVLEVDGKKLAQSAAIERYVASLAGLLPSDLFEAARCDEIKAFSGEFLEVLGPTFAIQDAEERLKKRQELMAGPIKEKLHKLVAILEASGGEYLVGGALSYADIVVYSLASMLASGMMDGVPANVLDDYPALKAHHNRVASLPKIAEQYANEKEGGRVSFKPLP